MDISMHHNYSIRKYHVEISKADTFFDNCRQISLQLRGYSSNIKAIVYEILQVDEHAACNWFVI